MGTDFKYMDLYFNNPLSLKREQCLSPNMLNLLIPTSQIANIIQYKIIIYIYIIFFFFFFLLLLGVFFGGEGSIYRTFM